MAITVTPGARQAYLGTFQAATDVYSTSTAGAAINAGADLIRFMGGTATGFSVNRAVLPAGAEGQYVTVFTEATGEHYLVMTGTATGARVYTATSQTETLRYLNGAWRVINTAGSPTIATATGTA
jgi:hypothetical protein